MLLLRVTLVIAFFAMPTKALVPNSRTRSNQLSPACINQTDQLRIGLRMKKMWALRMMDAYGKPSPGLLQQRLHWLGSYDECLSVVADPMATILNLPVTHWHGKYCLVSLSLEEFLGKPASIGVCFPEGCTPDDVKLTLDISGMPELKEVNLTVKEILGVQCRPLEIKYSRGCQALLTFLAIIGTLIIASTLYDACVADTVPTKPSSGPTDLANLLHNNQSGASSVSEYTMLLKRPITPREADRSRFAKLLRCFSLKTSICTLKDEYIGQGQGQKAREELESLHGVRVLTMLWIILGQTCFYAAQTPSANVAFTWRRLRSGALWQVVFNSDLGADTFFVISGLLVSYLTLAEMGSRNGKMSFLWFYLHRLWRLTPTYMLWIAIVSAVSPHFGNGPLWSEEGLGSECTTSWWTNLLYINNFVQTDNMCLPWTWYLANDFQFYIISPIIILFLYNFPAVGIFLCWLLALLSATLTGFITYYYHLPAGAAADMMFYSSVFVEKYYVKPYCRAAPYFLGVLTGYVLYRNRCELELNKTCLVTFTLIMTSCCLAVIFGTIGFTGDSVNQSVTAFYLSVSHLVWGMGVAWLLFICCTNNAAPLSRILSWDAWMPLSRLTYTVYLVHPVIILVYYLTMRVPFFFSKFSMTFAFIGNVILSYCAASVLYLCFEAPMMSLERVIFFK